MSPTTPTRYSALSPFSVRAPDINASRMLLRPVCRRSAAAEL
jgi:hypothetical protein